MRPAPAVPREGSSSGEGCGANVVEGSSFVTVKDIAIYGRWRDFVGILALAVVVLVVAGAVRGGPLLSSTAQVALPIAGLVCAGALPHIK